MAPVTSGNPTVMSASTFVIQVDGIQVASFSELSGINTEVEPVEYISTGPDGILHTKQYGKTKPPTVTLKRGMDTETYMWAWHQAVLQGEPTARKTCSLQLFAASQSPKSGQPMITYILENAWPSKLEISGMKAGASELVTETVVLHCDQILMQPAWLRRVGMLPGRRPVTATADPAPESAGMLTLYPFALPRGYVDEQGRIHRDGVMRLATARDEIVTQSDPRVQQNPAYLTVLLLARTITKLGSEQNIDTLVIENLFASDLAFLQDLYRRINTEGHTEADVACPSCGHQFVVDIAGDARGES